MSSNPEEYTRVATEAQKRYPNVNSAKAIPTAIVTGVDVGKVFDIMDRIVASAKTELDPIQLVRLTIKELGGKVQSVPMERIIAKYPPPHNTLKSVTTKHPKRFPKNWPKGRYLLVTSKGQHICAIVDGVLLDWSAGSTLRGEQILKITMPE